MTTAEASVREGMAMAKVPRVVIVGGGFGGFYSARALAKAPVQVTLVDRRNYHLFRPMLYQVAAGLLSADEIAPPLRVLFSKQKNVDVVMAEVTGVDTANRRVLLPEGDLPYDYLILATGIEVNYFGHDEWKSIAPGLDALENADQIRGRLLMAFEEAERQALFADADHDLIQELLTFVLVGAGTVGVELAGTIAEMAKIALANDFRHLGPGSAQILLYDGAARILPSFVEELSTKAQRHLEQLGVKIFTGTRVERVDAEGIVANGKRIRSRTVIWTAGVAASPAARWLGADADKSGRVKVNADLSVPGHAEIFAIGDTALVIANTRNLVGLKSGTAVQMPGLAQPAIQQGEYVADLIRRRTTGQREPEPFWYWDKGDLAVVGRAFAVADLRFWKSAGFVAWLLWAGVHIYFLIGFSNRIFVMLRWMVQFVTRRHGMGAIAAPTPAAAQRLDKAG
ncbi:MAG TPA: NAD(P)/FAD-dependent oxidoreductase [Acidobacteriaceae bacterium]|nr:NAD(P)/FAD-dependent oxidoreductase [Acidobacteriaceae bacterium]